MPEGAVYARTEERALGRSETIPFAEAFRIAMDSVRRVGTERVGLDRGLGRILAEDVLSDMDMPPFNKSAMDGYACRRADLDNELEVLETIRAGRVPTRGVGPNQCAKIMTGAMVPEGADCVVMVEYTENPTQNTMRFVGKGSADNICRKGEDIRKGDTVLRTGERITPPHIAVMASVGCVAPLVSEQAHVAVIATGDEIVEPEEKPSPSQIRNSNARQLLAQVERMGLPVRYLGIAKDLEAAIDRMIKDALAGNDVILISGGVSMGEFDLVPGMLRKNGFELLFEKVATKPGKPTIFGVSEDAFVFGLPGNPVSTFVLFEMLVKPFLYRMMGHDFAPRNVVMPLERTVSRRRTERMSWVPVVMTESGGVRPAEYHGSAHIHALCSADGLISMPVGVAELKEGTNVHVRQI